MRIVLLQHHEIDKKRWDTVISNSPHGLIYTYSWFLDMAAPGWCAMVADDYKYLMPLPVRTKWKLKYIYPPFFIQQLGIFSEDDEEVSAEITSAFLKMVNEHFRFAEMYLHEQCSVFSDSGFRFRKRINHLLPLLKRYESLSADYSSQLKRNLKKANSSGAVIRNLNHVSAIIKLFRKSESGRKSNYRTADFTRFELLIEECMKHDMAEISGVYDKKGVLQGGAVFLISHQRITFIFSGLSEYGREHSLLALLLDAKIRQHASSEMIFDFEGSMDKGLARFYKSFGSLETGYTFVTLNRLPKVIQWLK